MYIYIYSIYIYIYISPHKRSFRGLAVLLEDQIPDTGPKSVRGNWRLWSPVVSRSLPPFKIWTRQ